MELVLDTNKLFSFFWNGSLVKKLLFSHNLYSPEFALEELNKHRQEILKKTKLSLEDFKEFMKRLKELIIFVLFSEYSDKIPEAFDLLPEHPKDIDFVALALKVNAAIVSEDKELLKQSRIRVFNDSKLGELFN